MGSWLEERQSAGADSFAEQGWPTRALEAWKTTPIKPIKGFGASPLDTPSPADLERASTIVASLPATEGARLVIVGGHLVPTLSELGALNTDPQDEDASHLGTIAAYQSAPLVALSTCALSRAIVIRASEAKGDVVELVHVGRPGGGGGQCRVLIVADRSESLSVVEQFVDVGGDPAWTNSVTEVSVGENAEVEHVQIISGSGGALRTGHVTAQIDRDGRFKSHTVTLSGQIGRSEIHAKLIGTGASCQLDGLYVACGKTVADNYTEIEHIATHTTSGESYKGVIDDRATGGFVGRVLILEGAIQSQTHQLNNNLLLSDGAIVHTRPQLEIDNDDVVATHGSTVGQLDESAVFYLRSRGLSEDKARALMTWAFVKAQIDQLPSSRLREQVAQQVANSLSVDAAWVGE